MRRDDAEGWFDTTSETAMRVYRARDPEYQARAQTIMEGK
jgi:hypothetical protein